MPEWYWITSGVLAFVGTLLIGYSMAAGKEWPSRAFGFLGVIMLLWGIALTLVAVVIMAIGALT